MSRLTAFFLSLLVSISLIDAALASTATETAPVAAPVQAKVATAPISPNTVAQVLAGVTPPPGHPVVDRLVATPEWREHRDWSQGKWIEVNRRLDAIRSWRDSELKIPTEASKTLVYPFSGPDFLNADALFPNHPRMVFFSLERAGGLPDLTKLDGPQFARMLADARHALSDIFERNYFITSYMSQQLTTPQIKGTTPVIALMMVLTGNRILSIESIEPFPELAAHYAQSGNAPGAKADPGAQTTPSAMAGKVPPGRPRISLNGNRITFVRGNQAPRTLEYYGLDVTDQELRWYPDFLETIVGKAQPATVLIKSASYLLHDRQFAGTRAMILKTADIIVQDDTGVPLKFLKSAGMDVKLYGVYTAPIKPLTYATQPDLEAEFRSAGTVPPINFPFGYHGKSGRSMLLLAQRRK